MTDELFTDLPEQRAPTCLTTDTHVLEPCEMCTGSGKIYRYRDGHLRQVKCRTCTGHGKIIRPIGGR